ncbi:MAG: aquaporin, partial [Anaerovoracaceae bacterium]
IIGLAYALSNLVGLLFTGSSVNPARSLGPALLTDPNTLSKVWVFIVFPLIGGALAAFAFAIFSEDKICLFGIGAKKETAKPAAAKVTEVKTEEKKTPAKKTAAKKTSTKKAPAKKTPAKKKEEAKSE